MRWVGLNGSKGVRSLQTGLVAVATSASSTLLAMPGRQAGHVQLVSLPPCLPHTPSASTQQGQYRSPIILAHNHPLSTLACTANGSHVLTTSERGTLLRVWDTSRGRLERELRRGVDRADMWGVKFEDEVMEGDTARKGGMVVGWSDKGTIHVWEGDKAGEISRA
jgi:WD40 repeat protein